MIRSLLLVLSIGAAAAANSLAAASPTTASAGDPPPASDTPVRCADFRRQTDGAWTPRRPVVVGGVGLAPGVSFTPGVAFGGVDLAAVLDARCGKARPR